MKTKNLIQKIIYAAFLIFLIYLIFELLRKLFLGSLGFEEIVIGLLIANLGYSFYLTFYLTKHVGAIDSKISGHIGWHKGKNSR